MFFESTSITKHSLYNHLIRALIPGLVITLLLSGLAVKTVIGRNLLEQFDKTLDRQASAIIGITEQDEDGVELEIYEEAMPAYFIAESSDSFEVHDITGKRLFSSESMSNSSLGFELPSSKTPIFKNVALPNGSDGRLVRRLYFPKIDIDDDDDNSTGNASIPFYPPGQIIFTEEGQIIPTQVVVTVATSRYPLREVTNELNLILLIAGLITLFVLVLLQIRAIKKAVRPINALATELNTRSDRNITDQVTVDTPIIELNMLATRFNKLLQTVSKSMAREKAFSSNLAHEIRTPIAEIQSLLEVNSLWPEDSVVRNNLSTKLLASLQRMNLLVTDILAIGQGESGLLDTSGNYDINAGINQLLVDNQDSIEAKSLKFQLNMDASCAASSGSTQWPVILNNLVNNAIEHSPSESTITVGLICDDKNDLFELIIANPAGDLDGSDVASVFDRLWRKDISRTSSEHSGLGLSLVKTFCELLDYTIVASVNQKDDFEIRIQGQST